MSAKCQIPGCGRPTRHRHDECPMHYERIRRYGDPNFVIPRGPKGRTCNRKDCNQKHHARGLCQRHYKQEFPPNESPRERNSVGVPDLPVLPLLDYINARGGLTECLDDAGLTGNLRESVRTNVERAEERGSIPVPTADKVVIRLFNAHPFQVYGDDWWADYEFEEAA